MTGQQKEQKQGNTVVEEKQTCAHGQSPDRKRKTVKDKMIKIKDSQYQNLIKEACGHKDKYMRLCAEFENTRKRYDRDKVEFVKYANEGLITEFLGILDDLNRSVEAANTKHEDYEAFLKGVQMVMARIDEMLKKNEVKPIEATGRKFDPHCHEILMQVETDEHDDGMVVEEFQKGYLLGDRVIRTAKVKVAVKVKKGKE